ncbi:MAG: hypothetical protein H0X27_14355 [Caulobacteraceae bacterium]|nr:hypothetical protein [Caulobacteraceae bacterium]
MRAIFAVSLLAGLWSLPHAVSSQPHICPTPSCSTIEACERAAGWIIEGTVVDVVEGDRHYVCDLGPPGGLCRWITQAPQLVLEGVKQVQGNLNLVKKGHATIMRAASCFSGPLAEGQVPAGFSPYIGSESAGHRFRFYGDDKWSRWDMDQGFIVATALETTP